MKTTSQVIQDEILELKIRRSLIEHWNPSGADILTAAIEQLTNIYENKTKTPRGQGERHSRNRIRQIESGCEEKCPESNETNNLHS